MLTPERIIPHRPPFLFIDRVLEITDSYVRCERKLKDEEPFFGGHYPGNPIMPGVLLCEAVFQASAVYLMHPDKAPHVGKFTPVLSKIREARFKQIVRPGDLLTVEAFFQETLSKFYFMTGRVTKASGVAMTIDFALSLEEESNA